MKKLPIFVGTGTAMITPFKKDLTVDYESLKKLMEIQLKAGAGALIMCGTTGEASTLEREEKAEIIYKAKDFVKNDCAVIAGTGCNDTKKAVAFTKDAYEAGADGILAVTPYYNKTTQDGIIRYYKDICDASPLPVIAYNVPSRTCVNILPATAKELWEIPNLFGIKEASGNMAQITELKSLCGEMHIYSGSDEINLPILSVGGIGIISVVSNAVPEKTQEMCNRWFEGDTAGALRIQLSLMPLIKQLFSSVNPIPIKKYLYEKGLTEYVLRPPLYAE
ncbi:MAG: 4-hydroxy-tetrahydrodipicolinate synthase [Clostridia bacterium]|nr:4-hydroxy-tetrahydrodipicolinate synthase [Clostridia bacterium]